MTKGAVDGARRVFEGLSRAARHTAVGVAMAGLLATGAVVIGAAYVYALGSAVSADAGDDDRERTRDPG